MTLNGTLFAQATAAFVAAAACTLTGAQTSEYQRHLDAATLNAGKDPFFTGTLRPQWCWSAEHPTAPPELQDRALEPLTQIFDDLWYVGPRWVGQYIIKTSGGLFLIDTLNNTGEAQSITVPALQTLGLGANLPLLGAMPTHGHGDHFGGAAYLQTTYGIPIYLGSADAAGKPFVVTPLNSANLQPQSLQLPDRTLTLLSTPGHTPGTFSGVVPVRQDGNAYKLAFWGGTGMPTTLAPARQYLDGAERLYALARDQNVDGTMHTHPFVDGSLQHIDSIQASGRANNPFLLGNAQTLRSLAILRECAAAKVAQLDATALIPEWRVTTVEFLEGGPTPVSMSARVRSGWGPVQGQQVTFSVGESGAACVATTDASGVATCNSLPRPLRPGKDVVRASYAGWVSQSYVDLPSTSSQTLTTPGLIRAGK